MVIGRPRLRRSRDREPNRELHRVSACRLRPLTQSRTGALSIRHGSWPSDIRAKGSSLWGH